MMGLLWLMAGVPSVALGQGAIAGSVRDSSGASLPRVVVTVTSPELLETLRTAFTDDAGQYRIEALRPGIYTVTFSRGDLTPIRFEGVQVTGSFTAPVNAEFTQDRYTVTVTGGTSVIDVYTAKRELTLQNDILKSLPTVRSYNALLVLVPGIVTNTNDTVTGTAATQFPIHGGRTGEGRLSLDGLTVGSPPSSNSPTNYAVDVGNAQEVTFSISGALGEAETAGVVMNIVPKTGGNT